jgi:hypothetical protein
MHLCDQLRTAQVLNWRVYTTMRGLSQTEQYAPLAVSSHSGMASYAARVGTGAAVSMAALGGVASAEQRGSSGTSGMLWLSAT